MAISPVDAALDAIAAYFQGAVSGLTARRGWPEHPQDLDLSAGSVLTLVASGPGTASRCSPRSIDETVDEEEVTVAVLYRVGWLRIDAQLDLWCAYRARRDDMVALIEAAACNKLPFTSDLEATSTGYHSRPLKATLGPPRPEASSESVAEGEWRCTWDLTIETDLVAAATHPLLAEVVFQLTTEELGLDVVEPDITVTL